MKVLIVGCGLAGLATALGLMRKGDEGLQVVIVERRKDFESRGATFGLAPNGQVSLQEVPTNSFVWRGSVDTNAVAALKHLQEYPLSKLVSFGEAMILNYFNFHPKVDGTTAWVFACRNNVAKSIIPIESGTTTPLDLIRFYMESVENPDDDLLQNFRDAELLFRNTNSPSDLTWNTEMAVVDLTTTHGWGGRGRITLVGDAAHSLRPASGLGGSLAFEDAVLVSRVITCSEQPDLDLSCRLRGFEAKRLPRCTSLSRDQTIRSTLAYKLGRGVPPWDPEYRKWIFEGPDASPEPPVDETIVFGDLVDQAK